MFYLEKQMIILGSLFPIKMESQQSEKMDPIYMKSFSPQMDLTLKFIQWEVNMLMRKQGSVQLWTGLFREMLMERKSDTLSIFHKKRKRSQEKFSMLSSKVYVDSTY